VEATSTATSSVEWVRSAGVTSTCPAEVPIATTLAAAWNAARPT
jgi:hypothetical protein